jgi:acetate kinase
MHQAGIKRYGFHGLSYQSIAGQLPQLLGKVAEGRVVVAHLGSGASLCAMHHRQSVASTMGFSALDGLLMATRCGSLDAGVVLHLLSQGYDQQRLTQLLYKESGLLGVSGISGDMRDLQASPDPQAAEAIALFLYRAHQQLAAMVASLGGIDALVFTAGIGQHSVMVRSRLCQAAAWLGIDLDDGVNAAANPDKPIVLSTASSRVVVAMIPTDEEAVMADAVARLPAAS